MAVLLTFLHPDVLIIPGKRVKGQMGRAQDSDLWGSPWYSRAFPLQWVGGGCWAGQGRERTGEKPHNHMHSLLSEASRGWCHLWLEHCSEIFTFLRLLGTMPYFKQPKHFQTLTVVQWPLSYIVLCEYRSKSAWQEARVRGQGQTWGSFYAYGKSHLWLLIISDSSTE